MSEDYGLISYLNVFEAENTESYVTHRIIQSRVSYHRRETRSTKINSKVS